MKETLLKYLPFSLMLLFLGGMSLFFAYYSPDYLIELIGTNNAYIIMFVLSVAGGLSTFSGVPYHLVLIAFAAGGMNPWLLGIVTALGVMIGDSTSYYIGYEGKKIMPNGIQKFFQKIISILTKRPKLLPFLFLFYGSFLPFSNDFLVISMGYARYPFWNLMIPLGIGNIIFNTGLALLAIYAYNFLQYFY